MAYIDLYKAREELVVFLRNKNILTTAQRGVTTKTDKFNGDGVTVDFSLTPLSGSVRNVRTVTVNSIMVSFGSGYKVNYSTGVVTLATAPAAGTDNVEIQYDYGTGDKIFPDFPRSDLTLSSFPRIGVDIISAETTPGGHGNVHITNILFSVIVQDDKTKTISDYGSAIRKAFITARNSFYYLGLVIPKSIGPLILSPNKSDKIMQQNFDFDSRFNFEIN